MEALNPKTAAFFRAFVSGFVDPTHNVALQFVVLGLIVVIAGAVTDEVGTADAASAEPGAASNHGR